MMYHAKPDRALLHARNPHVLLLSLAMLVMAAHGASGGTSVSRPLVDGFNGALSPDGTTLAFQRDAGAETWLGLYDLRTVVLMDIDYDPKRAYESTREILSYAKAHCGKARLYFHCSTYAMPNGIPGYVKATGQNAPDVARELLRIAKDTGCAGTYLECVDYRNYSPDLCDALSKTTAVLTPHQAEYVDTVMTFGRK